QFTAHFRALRNSRQEVQEPLDQLVSWSLPVKLAPDGTLTNVLKGGVAARSIYPSKAPPIVAMMYADMLFQPMVIESISVPLTMPRDKDGHAISTSVQMSIASLTALDRADWASISLGRR
ncbi:MAG TPA: hypothetical protein VLJ86_13890, partial [Ramlibacter sp.]|nr:hypothetical protein [Ramlibacter sp.]